MKKRKSTWLLVGILVMAVALCLLMALNAAAAPAPLPEVGNKWLQDNMEKFPGMFDYESYQTKPVFSNDNDKVICEEVWIEVPCDVDGDGKRDLIRAQIRRPIETKEGLKTPVIAQLTPYSGQNATLSAPFGNKIDMDFPGASNPDTRHLDYLKDIRYDGPRYKDLLARNFGDLSEWGIPAARTPVSTQADAAPTANWNPTAWHAYFIPLGYSCASVTIIGSQFGEGFLTYGDYAENLSAAALVDWLNGRLPGYTSPTSLIKVEPPSWATGDVAMSGTSYGGTLPFAAAVTGVKGLKTIIPFAPPTSSYEYYRANGAVYAPGGWQGEDVSEIIAYCFGRGWVASSPTLPTPAIWNRFWEYLEENYQAQDSISGDYSKWWDGRNQVSFMEDIKELNPDLGIISFHGYNDDNVKFKNSAMMFKMAEKLGITVKGIFHQGMHTSPHNHNGLNFYPQIHKWFDHYLYGVENGMPGDFPNVRVQSNLDISWMESDTWPLGQYKNLYPIPGGMNGRVGSLRNSPPNVAVIIESKFKDDLAVRLTRPAFNLPTPPAHVPNYSENAAKYGGHVNPQMASAQYYRWRNLLLGGEDVTTAWTTPWTAPAGISYDLTKPVDDRLLFTMDVSEDMRISGTIKMTAQIKADKNVGFVSAMLVDYGSERRYGSGTTNTGTVVLPNGANLNLVSWSQNANATPARIISRGSVDIQNPNYDRKIWSDCPDTNFIPNYYFQTTAIEPGKYYSYTWELDVMDYTVLKGHKLGLLIYGTDPEYTTRPFNPTEFTIRLDAGVSYLSLPIVPAGPEKPVTIEAADVMAKPGDEVDVTYKIKDNAFGFTAMDLLVPYDSSIYAPIAIKPAAGLATPFFVANPSYQSGLMRIAFAAGENAEGDGLLFTVTYKVAATAPGTGDFPLDLEVVKMQYATSSDIIFDLKVIVDPGTLVIGIPGDVNGDGFVTPEDAMLILQMLVGLIEWTPRAQLLGDINGDGLVDTTDAALILRMVVGGAARTTLLYQGHGSLRITTGEGKVIYIDPYAGTGYDLPADLILITHAHSDHTAVGLIETKNPDCKTITYAEALVAGEHKTFDLGFVTVEAVEAGNNPNHNINVCVGYILTFSNGKTVYVSGDTSKTAQMATFAVRNLDYAFFCCDGRFNMDMDEAIECAALVGAKHNIPYHIASGLNFDRERAELFIAPNRLIIADGEEISF